MRTRRHLICGLNLLAITIAFAGAADSADPPVDPRPPRNDEDLAYWLRNMVVHHHFTDPEVASVTGLPAEKVASECERLGIDRKAPPRRSADAPLTILPYPGGRHPRIGFLDGAVRPQRETKVSVFCPWDNGGYVVVDVPEAIFSNLGLTYLAHTHVPTIWTEKGVDLPKLEWNRQVDGSLDLKRSLPNRVAFESKVVATQEGIRMSITLENGTTQTLKDLRIQNCVMLKGAPGFEQQTNDNKIFQAPYAACRGEGTDRWVITAWEPCNRAWGNPPCPCLHSDPKFEDCPPEERRTVVGWLSFYVGPDIEGELRRLDQTDWRKGP